MSELMTRDFTSATEPFGLFEEWFEEASASEPNDPNAMALATVDASGMPDVRMVLLKGVDARGFVFYTNTESAKGGELAGCMKAALCLHWKSLLRQVRVRGPVEPVSAAEADAYFASRHRDSRVGAWASRQSRPLEHDDALREAVTAATERFAGGEVPRPQHWTGFRVRPLAIEFWHDRPFRLHDRLVFSRTAPDAAWRTQRLYP